MKTESHPVSIHQDKETKELVLFFTNSNLRMHWIECFTEKEGHSEASIEYMRKACAAIDYNSKDCKEFFERWINNSANGNQFRLVKRLPKGF